MRISVNELEILARRAAVGAGIEHGYAYEASISLVWLCAAGVDCIPGFVDALRARAEERSGRVAASRLAGTVALNAERGRRASALYTAPTVRDFTAIMEDDARLARIEARNVEQPYFVLARLAGHPPARGMMVRCTEPGAETVRWTASLPGESGKGRIRVRGDIRDAGAADLSVVRSPVGDRGADGVLEPDMEALFARGVAIDRPEFHALKRFVSLTLVPDSDASRRHGAGAGLVDSD